MRITATWTMALILAGTPAAGEQILTTVAGGGPTGLPELSANVSNPGAILVAPSGGLTILTGNGILEVDAGGGVRVIAGEGVTCHGLPYGDGQISRKSCLSGPRGLARDAAGNLYVSDTLHHGVRRIDAKSGIITRYAGNYTQGYLGDGGPATAARVGRPHGLAFDPAGNLLIVDRMNHAVRRVSASTGLIQTIAGTGFATGSIDGEGFNPADDLGDGKPANEATLTSPYGVAVDAAGNVYIGDMGNHRVRRISAATGIMSTVAGNGAQGYAGDGVQATDATLIGPAHLSIDASGNLLIADMQDLVFIMPEEDQENHKIRRLDIATGILTTVAGAGYFHFGGDGGPATGAGLHRPAQAAADAGGNIYIADTSHHRIRKVAAGSGIITTVAGNGYEHFSGDGFSSGRSRLYVPDALRSDAAGNLYVADSGNSRIRKISAATGIITTIAGNGSVGRLGDGGPALQASFDYIAGLAVDAVGNVYVADGGASNVRRIDAVTGIVSLVAGNGSYGYAGDGGPAVQAMLAFPESVAVDAAGDVFIADTDNNRVRKVSAATGIITTVAGTGVYLGDIDGEGGIPSDDLGDGRPATEASISYPLDVLVDASGNLLISEWKNRVRRVSAATGIIETMAGNGSSIYSGDGGPATAAGIYTSDLALDAGGNLFITGGGRIRRVDAGTGIVSTVMGTGASLYSFDGTAATGAPIVGCSGVTVDGNGRLYFLETGAYRVRSIEASTGSSSVPDGSAPGEVPLTVARTAGGDLTLSWGGSCLATDLDYAMYEGSLGDFGSHAPVACSTSGATAMTLTPAAGGTYYLVVPRSGVSEGSYGLTSSGAQRPASTAACVPQQVTQICE